MYHQKYKYKLLTFDVYITIGNKSGEEYNIFLLTWIYVIIVLIKTLYYGCFIHWLLPHIGVIYGAGPLHEHMCFSWVRVARPLVFCLMFCISLFVLKLFYQWISFMFILFFNNMFKNELKQSLIVII